MLSDAAADCREAPSAAVDANIRKVKAWACFYFLRFQALKHTVAHSPASSHRCVFSSIDNFLRMQVVSVRHSSASLFPPAMGNDYEPGDDAEVLEPTAARAHNPNFLF